MAAAQAHERLEYQRKFRETFEIGKTHEATRDRAKSYSQQKTISKKPPSNLVELSLYAVAGRLEFSARRVKEDRKKWQYQPPEDLSRG
jgi:hypothetical protein